MAQFFEDLERFDLHTNFFAGTLTREFVFDGYTDDDAYAQAPREGSTFVRDSKTFVCKSRGITAKYRDDSHPDGGAGRVTCFYSTGSTSNTSFKPFDLTYQKIDIKLPEYTRGTHLVPKDLIYVERGRWYAQETSIPVQFHVLSITVRLWSPGSVSNQSHVQAIARAYSQVGHMHALPLSGASPWSFNGGIDPLNPAPSASLWVMQPPSFRQTSYEYAELMYTWILDPGNSAPGLPPQLPRNRTPADFILAPPRPPWYGYGVVPPQGLDTGGDNPEETRPGIYVRPIYPARVPNPFDTSQLIDNPYITNNGWLGLPGNPLS